MREKHLSSSLSCDGVNRVRCRFCFESCDSVDLPSSSSTHYRVGHSSRSLNLRRRRFPIHHRVICHYLRPSKSIKLTQYAIRKLISRHSTLMGKITRSYLQNEHLFKSVCTNFSAMRWTQGKVTDHGSWLTPRWSARNSAQDQGWTFRCGWYFHPAPLETWLWDPHPSLNLLIRLRISVSLCSRVIICELICRAARSQSARASVLLLIKPFRCRRCEWDERVKANHVRLIFNSDNCGRECCKWFAINAHLPISFTASARC